MSVHLKLHPLTGNTDQDLTGLAAGQIVYVKDYVDGVQSTGLFTNGSGGLSASTISATTISGGTLYSGNTNIYNIFTKGSGTSGTLSVWNGSQLLGDSLLTQAGTGVTVNGSVQIYGDVNILGTATTFNTTTIQTSDNNITMNLSGSHVSAFGGGITVLSGRPDNTSSTWTIDANGTWSANTGINASALTISGGAIISGGTNLYNIFARPELIVNNVNAGSNITTGGTAISPTINVAASPSFNGLTLSGAGQFAGITATSMNGGTVSGGTLYSGSTNLTSIFQPLGSISVNSAGTNTYTGGTFFNQTINVSALTINTLSASGSSQLTDITGSSMFLSGTGAGILTVVGSGTTTPIFRIQGSQGELFSIYDSLSGSLFSVNDISGLPILEVFSDSTLVIGDYFAPSLYTTKKMTATTGSNTIYNIPTSAYTSAYFDYNLSSTSGIRAGNVMAVWSGSNVQYTETTTNDIGDTSSVTFSVSISGTNASLIASATTAGWTVKTIIKSI